MRNKQGADIQECVQNNPPSHLDLPGLQPLPTGRGNKDNADGDGTLDEVVQEFKGYFELMDKNTPLVQQWLALPNGIADPSLSQQLGGKQLFNNADKDDLNQFKGVNVASLAGLTQRLRNVGSAMDALDQESQALRGDTDETWKGRGSETALKKFDDLSTASRTCKDQSNKLSSHVQSMYAAAYGAKQQLLKFVNQVCDGGEDNSVMSKKIGIDSKEDDQSLDIGQDGDETRDRLSSGLDNLKKGLASGLYRAGEWNGTAYYEASGNPHGDAQNSEENSKPINGQNFPGYIQPAEVTPALLNTPGRFWVGDDADFYSDQICRAMNMLSKYYITTLLSYRQVVDSVRKDMLDSMEKLNGALSEFDRDPFGKLVGPGEAPPPKQEKRDTGGEPKKQEPRDTGGGDTGPAETGGGGETGPQQGGDGPSTGGSTIQPPPRDSGGTSTMPTPGGQADGGQLAAQQMGNGGTPQMPGTDGQQASSMPQMPGLTSTQGMADQQDGAAGQPGMPGMSGQSMPGQQDGQPASVKMTGPGGHDLELTSPDGQGHMRVSVDDGSGHPQKFDVDFGQGQQGQHGQQGQPGMPDQSGGSPVSQVLGGLQGDHGGSPDAGPGQDGAQHVQADQSGHAQFKAGENTISVDKAPGSDEVKVTVDDGSGKPTTMTVDSGGDAPGQGQPSPAGLGDSSGSGGPALGGGETGGLGHDPGGTHPADARAADGGASVGSSPDPGGMPGGGGSAGGDLGSAPDAGGAPDTGMGQQQQPLQQGPTTGAEPSGGGGPHGGGADVGHSPAPQSGGAPAGGGGGGAHGGGGMGMPMMGGMGMGGGGGDQERGASSWRTEGNLFDDADNSVAADFAEEALRGADNENWR